MVDTVTVSSRWLKVRIGDLVERHQEQVSDAGLVHFAHYVGVDHLDAGDIFLRRASLISDGGLPPTFRYAFRRGMFLFPTRRPKLNKYAVVNRPGVSGELRV
jgi:type I restriction enzyme S subunit